MRIRTAAYAGIFLWGLRKILRKLREARKPIPVISRSEQDFIDAYNENMKKFYEDSKLLYGLRFDWRNGLIQRCADSNKNLSPDEKNAIRKELDDCCLRHHIDIGRKEDSRQVDCWVSIPRSVEHIQIQCTVQKSRLVR